MPAPVARQERDVAAGQRAQNVVVRRAAEGRSDVEVFLGFKTGHAVEPAAADDADFRFQWLFSWVDRPQKAMVCPTGLVNVCAPESIPTARLRWRRDGRRRKYGRRRPCGAG